MLWGTTYSHRHASLLGLDSIQTFRQLLAMKFDIIRLGCYWDEIERKQGVYDYSVIKTYLDLAEKVGQNVVLTVGMKAPRWPEFFIPTWLQAKDADVLAHHVVTFVERTVTELKAYPHISHWQVENEPLDPSGPEKRVIPLELLLREHAVMRSSDSKRPIIINFWGNELTKRNLVPTVSDCADIIGLDVYYKVFVTRKLSHSFYLGPRDSEENLRSHVQNCERPLWITELQAEPWEANHEAYLSDNPGSMNPERLRKNVRNAMQMQPAAILLWGSEYWFWKKTQKDSRMLDTVEDLIQ